MPSAGPGSGGGGGSSVLGASPSVMTARTSVAGGVVNKLRGRLREQGTRAAASDRYSGAVCLCGGWMRDSGVSVVAIEEEICGSG